MHSTIELNDSEVSSVAVDADGLRIRFSAARVQQAMNARYTSAGDVYAQAIELHLGHAAWIGEPKECLGELSEGRLEVNGLALAVVPLPYTASGKIRLSARFANGSKLDVSATHIEFIHLGEPRFVEAFSC